MVEEQVVRRSTSPKIVEFVEKHSQETRKCRDSEENRGLDVRSRSEIAFVEPDGSERARDNFPAAETKPSIIFCRLEGFLTVHLHKYEVKACRLEAAYRCYSPTKFKIARTPFLSVFLLGITRGIGFTSERWLGTNVKHVDT